VRNENPAGSRHARGDPHALPRSPTRWRWTCSAPPTTWMIYEVRDFCTALVNVDGELGQPERRRRLAFRRRPWRHHHRRDEASTGGRDSSRATSSFTNHQAVPGAPEQHSRVRPCFFRGELSPIDGARSPLDRRRRHEHRIRRRSRGARSLAGGAAARPAEDLPGGKSSTRRLYRVIRDNIRFPESSLATSLADRLVQLGARRIDELFRKYGRSTVLAAIAGIFDEPRRSAARSSRAWPTASTRRVVLRDDASR